MPPTSAQVHSTTEELVPLVYDELRKLAWHYFRNQPPGFTLRPTEMVHEACIHLIQHSKEQWQSPQHFRAIATRKIWQIVVDHLRKRGAGKRGGQRSPSRNQSGASAEDLPEHRPPEQADPWRRIPLNSVEVEWHDRVVDFLDLAEALDALRAESRLLSEIVILHWFGGLKYGEVADYLGISTSSVEKKSRYALAWLNRRLAGADEHGD
ncbi:MAG: sigma-70 family RNA polymerase sigma factor [Phycisphaerales bacterium]|nr:sigma-70 family RNA polymerase sigma factor [Phycisphaerales bacterium]